MKNKVLIIGILISMLLFMGCSSEQRCGPGERCGLEQSSAPTANQEIAVPDLPEAPAFPTTPAETPAGGDESAEVAQTDSGAKVVEIDMIAKQFEFVPSTIEVNQGDTVVIKVKSIDVPHGLAIPDYGIRQRLDPGKEEIVEFVADKKGTFGFFCSVSCGSGHRGMTGELVVS